MAVFPSATQRGASAFELLSAFLELSMVQCRIGRPRDALASLDRGVCPELHNAEPLPVKLILLVLNLFEPFPLSAAAALEKGLTPPAMALLHRARAMAHDCAGEPALALDEAIAVSVLIDPAPVFYAVQGSSSCSPSPG